MLPMNWRQCTNCIYVDESNDKSNNDYCYLEDLKRDTHLLSCQCIFSSKIIIQLMFNLKTGHK